MKEYKNLNDYELLYMVSENDECAKDLIYDKYKPLIINTACKYYKIGKRFGLEIDDFIQEGYYGLYQALANFSENKECLFYTYALRSINSKMHNLCVRNSTKKNITLNNSISLNLDIGNDNDTTLMDMIEDNSSPDPWKLLDSYDFYKDLKKYVYSASIIEGPILELKLNGFSNASISEILGKSRNSISKSLIRIKKKMECSLH